MVIRNWIELQLDRSGVIIRTCYLLAFLNNKSDTVWHPAHSCIKIRLSRSYAFILIFFTGCLGCFGHQKFSCARPGCARSTLVSRSCAFVPLLSPRRRGLAWTLRGQLVFTWSDTTTALLAQHSIAIQQQHSQHNTAYNNSIHSTTQHTTTALLAQHSIVIQQQHS